jgi:serine/threonine-protein kinase
MSATGADAAVLTELDRVLASEAFQGTGRASTLLRFLVTETLAGRTDRLKEYTLGAEALGKGDDFDPRADPIVRAEMSRLRARLDRYYEGDGRADALVILLPKGSYVPQFQARDATPDAASLRPRRGRGGAVRAAAWFAGGVLAATAVFLATVTHRHASNPIARSPLPMRFDVDLAPAAETIGSEVGTDVVISPDGTRVVFVSTNADGRAHLNTRRLDETSTTELPGTEGARGPFFSPDGRWVAFWADGKLKKTPVDGGAPVVLCDATDLLGGSWGADDVIVAAALRSRDTLWRVAASGGTPTLVADFAKDGLAPAWPEILPDGRHVLFTAASTLAHDAATLDVLSLDDGRRTTLVRAGTFGRYVAGGYLLYVNQGSLYATRVDLARGVALGDAVPVLNDVTYSSTFGFAQMAVSRTGTLVYQPSSGGGAIVASWLDGAGHITPFLAKPGHYLWPRLSPDGHRLAFTTLESGSTHIVIVDETGRRIASLAAEGVAAPVWTPDGRRLLFSTGGSMSWISPGDDEPHDLGATGGTPLPWTMTGDRLAYYEMRAGTEFDLWTIPFTSDANGVRTGAPKPYLQTTAFEVYPTFSPDGRWIAYGSNQSGAWEVYVRAFPDDGRAVQVSSHGGRIPRWMPNGRELLYRTDGQQLMIVPYAVHGGTFVPDAPRLWSSRRLADTGVLSNFDVAPDGSRVLALLPAAEGNDVAGHRVRFVLNVVDEIERRLAR